jgi:transcriptional regulator with XRE-family HTH domain
VNRNLTISERLKDLRVERGLNLEELSAQTGLSKSALGSYEAEDGKDISHRSIVALARFYGVSADYLLGLTEIKNHPNAALDELHLSDEMIEVLKSEAFNPRLLCEMAAHPEFAKISDGRRDLCRWSRGDADTNHQFLRRCDPGADSG